MLGQMQIPAGDARWLTHTLVQGTLTHGADVDAVATV